MLVSPQAYVCSLVLGIWIPTSASGEPGPPRSTIGQATVKDGRLGSQLATWFCSPTDLDLRAAGLVRSTLG